MEIQTKMWAGGEGMGKARARMTTTTALAGRVDCRTGGPLVSRWSFELTLRSRLGRKPDIDGLAPLLRAARGSGTPARSSSASRRAPSHGSAGRTLSPTGARPTPAGSATSQTSAPSWTSARRCRACCRCGRARPTATRPARRPCRASTTQPARRAVPPIRQIARPFVCPVVGPPFPPSDQQSHSIRSSDRPSKGAPPSCADP